MLDPLLIDCRSRCAGCEYLPQGVRVTTPERAIPGPLRGVECAMGRSMPRYVCGLYERQPGSDDDYPQPAVRPVLF